LICACSSKTSQTHDAFQHSNAGTAEQSPLALFGAGHVAGGEISRKKTARDAAGVAEVWFTASRGVRQTGLREGEGKLIL
jgi:hypothetical protein